MKNPTAFSRHLILWVTVLFVGHGAMAYDFHQADANRLASLIAESLRDMRANHRPEQLSEIVRLFSAIDRSQLDGEGLIELKYLMALYRAAVVELRLRQAPGAGEREGEAIVDDLDTVGGFLSGPQSSALLSSVAGKGAIEKKALEVVAKFGNPRAIRPLIAERGDAEMQRLAGPREMPMYDGPGYSKENGNDGWVGKEGLELSAYRATSRYSAIVRGIEVRSGDIYLLDQGVTAGINTNFSVPRSYASHVGLIVFLERGGKVYPAFFEIAERGLRVLPLNAAFAPPFTMHGEVFRPAGSPTDPWIGNFPAWARKLSADVQARLPVKYFYDYDAPEIHTGEETGVVCSTQVQVFLLRNGIHLNLQPDGIDERAKQSLRSQFHYPLERYVTPTSFLRAGNSQVYFVGAVESDLVKLDTAREMVIGGAGEVAPSSLGYLFSHFDLDLTRISPAALKQRYRFLQLMAPVVLASGTVQVKAPASVLAFAKVLDVPLTDAVRHLEADFDRLIYSSNSFEPFSLHEKALEPALVQRLTAEMAGLRAWYTP